MHSTTTEGVKVSKQVCLKIAVSFDKQKGYVLTEMGI